MGMTSTTPPGATNRQCFYIPPSSFVEGCGFVPSLVTENEPGHSPMIGKDDDTHPWF